LCALGRNTSLVLCQPKDLHHAAMQGIVTIMMMMMMIAKCGMSNIVLLLSLVGFFLVAPEVVEATSGELLSFALA
jgi:hypothetical protein